MRSSRGKARTPRPVNVPLQGEGSGVPDMFPRSNPLLSPLTTIYFYVTKESILVAGSNLGLAVRDLLRHRKQGGAHKLFLLIPHLRFVVYLAYSQVNSNTRAYIRIPDALRV